MKFVDTAAEYRLFKKSIQKRHKEILKSGTFLFGKETTELEQNFNKVSNKKYNVTVKNCTDALTLILGKIGRPIILPNFGAYPTAVAARGLTNLIWYVDVDETLTIDPKKLPSHVKHSVIIPVHLFGNNCNMPAIMEYAKNNHNIVIEDCAQATGSGCGGHGDYSVFSFYPTKPLASMGDGGMICFNNEEEVDYFKRMRFYGQKGHEIEQVGINSRMDEFQAATVNSKLDGFHELNQKRREIAARYKKIIRGIKDNNSVYHQFVMLFNERDVIINALNKRKIPYMIHYPNHLSEIDSLKGIHNDVGVRLNDKAISLPVHPYMKETDIQKVEHFLEDYKDYEFIFPQKD